MHESVSVRQYAGKWLPIAKASVSDKCYNDYAKQLDVLCDTIGDMPVQSVKPSDIKTVYARYVGYSQSTIHRAKMLFSAMFDSAA